MLPESHTAVIERNQIWANGATSEPYEAGWAREAIFFVRALDVEGNPQGAVARVQISPDGIRWIDKGPVMALPAQPDAIAFCSIGEFGTWLRLAADIPEGSSIKVLVTLALKQ
jgi:hypothetical protein